MGHPWTHDSAGVTADALAALGLAARPRRCARNMRSRIAPHDRSGSNGDGAAPLGHGSTQARTIVRVSTLNATELTPYAAPRAGAAACSLPTPLAVSLGLSRTVSFLRKPATGGVRRISGCGLLPPLGPLAHSSETV